MGKAIIIMEDTLDGIDCRLEFDPPASVGNRISGAQWLAGEMLKVASKVLEQASEENDGKP
jgi:hypothetical protein